MKVSVMRNVIGGVAAGAIAVGLVIVAAGSASATPPTTTGTVNASVSLVGGTMTMSVPSTLAFPDSTVGTNQSIDAPLPLDIQDNTGLGDGWNVTLTSTTFTSGSTALPNDAASDQGATGACDTSITCTLGTNAVFYPLGVPAATVAPTAVEIQNASVGSGMAGQTWTHTMALALPADSPIGTYASTWTYSLVSGP